MNLLWNVQCAFRPIYIVVNGQILSKESKHLVTLPSTSTSCSCSTWITATEQNGEKNLETHFLCLKENWRNDWFGQIDFNWNKNYCNYWTKKLDRTRTVVVVKWSPCSPSTLTKPVRILLKPLVLIMSKYLKKRKRLGIDQLHRT